ncbi:hypothetical protein Dimus_031452, partial [Dionaea muscipula]
LLCSSTIFISSIDQEAAAPSTKKQRRGDPRTSLHLLHRRVVVLYYPPISFDELLSSIDELLSSIDKLSSRPSASPPFLDSTSVQYPGLLCESSGSCSQAVFIPQVKNDLIPKLNQEFECLDDVQKFYNNYAKEAGF